MPDQEALLRQGLEVLEDFTRRAQRYGDKEDVWERGLLIVAQCLSTYDPAKGEFVHYLRRALKYGVRKEAFRQNQTLIVEDPEEDECQEDPEDCLAVARARIELFGQLVEACEEEASQVAYVLGLLDGIEHVGWEVAYVFSLEPEEVKEFLWRAQEGAQKVREAYSNYVLALRGS